MGKKDSANVGERAAAEERSVSADDLRAGAKSHTTGNEMESGDGGTPNTLYIQQTLVGQQEAERRKQGPIFVSGDLVAREHERIDHVYIVDNRLGFTNKTNRFWINHLPGGGEDSQVWKTIGHRHTVEAVILFMGGHGYSVIDGKRYNWKAGDFICVPMFAWHRHVNLAKEKVRYAASTTGPLMTGIGQALYEDENYPELWVFASQDSDTMDTLIPGGSDSSEWEPEAYQSRAAELYRQEVSFATREERQRRESRVLVKPTELEFGRTPMGSVAYVVDSRLGFATKALGTLIGEVPPGHRSGSHRHLYDEIDFVMSGIGQATVDNVTFDVKAGDTLAIPPFAWHQYFNTGAEPLRILVHHTRTMLENLGLSLVQQGEHADF